MIIPAIDLLNNVVVRLTQGRYNTPSYYDIDASQLARRYATQGAKMLHLVDLSGAKDAQARSTSGLLALTKSTDLAWQVGGGIRSAEDIQQLLDHGVSRVVVGSMAIRHPELVAEWLMRFGADKIVLALDVRPTQDGRWLLPVDGWTTETNRELKECLAFYARVGVRHILCTDISRPECRPLSKTLSPIPGYSLAGFRWRGLTRAYRSDCGHWRSSFNRWQGTVRR